MVPSRIELLISALLAPRLNQLGQGTYSCYGFFRQFVGGSEAMNLIAGVSLVGAISVLLLMARRPGYYVISYETVST